MTVLSEPTELILLPSLAAQRGRRGGLILTQKYMSGAAEFAKYWPGPVTSLVQVTDTPTSDMDHVEFLPDEAETGLELRPDGEQMLERRLASAAAVLAFLSPFEASTARLCSRIGLPITFTSEYSPKTERQIVNLTVENPLRRWRRKLWLWQSERSRRDILRYAGGVQCSGTPTYNLYQKFNSNPLLFFDNRVRLADIVSEEEFAAKAQAIAAARPLRLVFGGRLIAMKGVLQLPRFARELKRLGVPFSLAIYGAGDCEPSIRKELAAFGLEEQVRLGGVLDFESGWVPTLKREADLFICCHPQGDPSSTYPEVMACGVPIAGYDNEAFVGIVEHSNGGWPSPLNQPERLATIVARLHDARGELIAAAGRARRFAADHAFEHTFARRIAHLVKSSRLPDRLKAGGTPAPAPLPAPPLE